ncbi:MAG: ATP-binding protein [Actinomycetota bacterium]
MPETDFGRRKARALLKLLALQPAWRLHRDQAIEWLWPELDLHAASGQLYKAVHHIRRAFDGAAPGFKELLQFREGVLWLETPGGIHTDILEFERFAEDGLRTQDTASLHKAVAAYEGDLLPGDLYEEWTLEQRDGLRALYLDVLTTVANRQLESGYVAEAADSFRRVVERDTTREEAHRGLMKVHALEGNTDRAAHQYDVCAGVLRQDLGVAPSSETVALRKRIEGGDFERVVSQRVAASASPKSSSPLVGRDAHLASLRALMDRLDEGRGGALTIEGEAGVGKTRLVAEALHMATTRGWQTLYGGSERHEGRVPYGPFIEALRSALRVDRAAADLIPAELAASIPEVPLGAVVSSADAVAARNALFAGVLRFLVKRVRDRPAVVILEDLHSADDGTIKLFHYLTRSAPDLPLLLIGSLRWGEPDAPAGMDEVLIELSARGLLLRSSLEPLSQVEHEALLGHLLGGGEIDSEVAEDLYRLCEGNPLFTTEVVNQLLHSARLTRTGQEWSYAEPGRRAGPLDAVPMSLRSLLRSRLARLSVEGRKVLDLAAVAGNDVAFEVLQAGAATGLGISAHRLLDLVDEALSARLLEEAGLDYRFSHALFREGLRAQLAAGRRRSLHGHVARVLEDLHTERQRPVEALAHHYAEAGQTANAVACLIEAGDGAEAVYDHDDALRRYRDALALLRQESGMAARLTELHERIGDVHRAVGQVDAAFESYSAALAFLDAAGESPPQRAGLHRKIVITSMLAPDMAAAAAHLALAREAIGPAPLEEARHLILQALFDWHMNMLEEAVRHAEQALRIAEEQDAATEIAQACEMLALAHFPLGNWDEGLHYEQRRATRDWSPDIVVACDAHLCLWDARVHGNEPRERAERFIAEAADQATAQGNLRCLAVCHYALGMIELLRGRFDLADDHLVRSLELHEEVGSTAGMAYVLARRISLMTARGDLSGGASLIERGLDVAQTTAVGDHALMLMLAAATRNRLQAGDRAGTNELMGAAEELDKRARPCPVCSAEILPAMAAAQLERGLLEEAWDYARRAEEIAGMGNNVIGAARAQRIQARVQHLRGSVEEATRSFSKAADVFRAYGQRQELLGTLLAWADLPKANEARAEAADLLAGKVLGRPSF